MTTVRTELEIDEVSLVDKGANPGAKVALFKRALEKAASFQDILDGIDATQRISEINQRLFQLGDALWTAFHGIMEDSEVEDKQEAIQQSLNEFNEAMRAGLEKVARAKRGEDMSDDVKKLQGQVDDLTKRAEEAEAKVEKAEANAKVAQDEAEALRKKYEPEQGPEVPEEIQKRLDTQAEVIRKLLEQNEQVVLSKLAGELEKLPAEAADLVKVIKSVPEGAERDALVALLKAAQEGINVTKEIGAGGDVGANGAIVQIETLAKELLQKGDATSIHDARHKVRKAHPALKEQEVAERRALN